VCSRLIVVSLISHHRWSSMVDVVSWSLSDSLVLSSAGRYSHAVWLSTSVEGCIGSWHCRREHSCLVPCYVLFVSFQQCYTILPPLLKPRIMGCFVLVRKLSWTEPKAQYLVSSKNVQIWLIFCFIYNFCRPIYHQLHFSGSVMFTMGAST